MKGTTNSVKGPRFSGAFIQVLYPIGYTCIISYNSIIYMELSTSNSEKIPVKSNATYIVTCYKNGIERGRKTVTTGDSYSITIVEFNEWLTFSGPYPFELVSGDGSRIGWDGTIEYSTDGTSWFEWNGITALESGVSGSKNVLYVRGSNNTVITGPDSTSAGQGWHFSSPGISIDGNIAMLLDWETVDNGDLPELGDGAFWCLFSFGTSSEDARKEYLEHSYGLILPWLTLSPHCYHSMLQGNNLLCDAPILPATVLSYQCYGGMFQKTSISMLHDLPVIEMPDLCYRSMYAGCSNIKLSATKIDDYQTPYRIPKNGTGIAGTDSILYMFHNTGGTVTDDLNINTTYYTSNQVIGGD